MNTSFYNGIAGMKTQQVGIDVWGDNISNINTIGFKQKELDFSSLFSASLTTSLGSPVTSDIGLSSTSVSSVMNLSQGSVKSTDNVFDLALNGKGWMSVSDINGTTYYTRTGSFSRDANGTLVNDSGDKLQVVNANNLKLNGTEWTFDSSIDTSDLVKDGVQTTSIDLPDNIIFPPQVTKKISLAGNLPNQDIAPSPKPAIASSDFGVLYDENAQNMNIKNGNDVVFGFGKDISYSDGLVRYDICIDDDEVDGNEVEVDFDVNDINIKLTLPDGSKAKTIVDAIAQKLDDNDILYDKTDNSIQIKDSKKLFIKSNGGDIVTNTSAMQKLVYDGSSNTDEKFTTMQDFNDDLQNLATFTYGTGAKVGIDESGKFYIQNNTDDDVFASSYSTDNSNDKFIQNLARLGNIIKPSTSSNSLVFNQNYQGFTGDIIDPNGNKNDLKFDFYKTKIDGSNTIWKLDLSEVDKDGNILSTQTQNLTFDNIGGLVTPTNITFNNNGASTDIDLGGAFEGLTAIDKNNTGFAYSQDGFLEGNLISYDIGDDGTILANFSNSKSGILGQIPIYHFQNEQGLDVVGGNKFITTDNSGSAFLYKDNEGNYLSGANIKNYALEASNVNMGHAMTELIVIQKAFDANSKSITTSDQMIQKAIDMKR